MLKLIDYNGIQIVTPDPLDEGGDALNSNFKALSTHIDTIDPAPSNDSTQGYSYGSRWYNSGTSDEWICVDPTQGAAQWMEISLLGPEGPQGPQGNDGAQGAQGNDGAQGAQGSQGNDGAQGAQGSQGNDGAQGASGPQGNDGAQGAQGDAGPTGAQGPQGNDGAVGPQGPQGDAGPTGAQGPQGDAGAQGAQGDVGPQGSQGPQGIVAGAGVYWTYSTSTSGSGYLFVSGTPTGTLYFGDTDANGNDVTPLLMALTNGSYVRVYDVADPNQQLLWELTSGPATGTGTVNFSYATIETVGTIPNNTLVLACPTIRGNDGAQGPQGFQGDFGSQGPQGYQGNDGAQGPQGNDGAQGDAGPQGPQGDKTAILPIDGEFLGLFCAEAPQSYFFDVMEVQLAGSYAIDRAFVVACEPGTIKVWATHCDRGMPHDLQCRVVDNRVVVKTSASDVKIRISLLGEKTGTGGRRFPRYTREQAEKNNRFWSQAHTV